MNKEPICHPDRQHEAHELCKPCYDKVRKNREYYRDYYARNKDTLKAKKLEYQRSMGPVVYRWMDENGDVVYVGRGNKRRAMEHRGKAAWMRPEYTVHIEECGSEWEAMMLEGAWGMTFLPRYNKEGYRHAKTNT